MARRLMAWWLLERGKRSVPEREAGTRQKARTGQGRQGQHTPVRRGVLDWWIVCFLIQAIGSSARELAGHHQVAQDSCSGWQDRIATRGFSNPGCDGQGGHKGLLQCGAKGAECQTKGVQSSAATSRCDHQEDREVQKLPIGNQRSARQRDREVRKGYGRPQGQSTEGRTRFGTNRIWRGRDGRDHDREHRRARYLWCNGHRQGEGEIEATARTIRSLKQRNGGTIHGSTTTAAGSVTGYATADAGHDWTWCSHSGRSTWCYMAYFTVLPHPKSCPKVVHRSCLQPVHYDRSQGRTHRSPGNVLHIARTTRRRLWRASAVSQHREILWIAWTAWSRATLHPTGVWQWKRCVVWFSERPSRRTIARGEE